MNKQTKAIPTEEQEPAIESTLTEETTEAAPSIEVGEQTIKFKNTYPTEHFIKNNIPYCTFCGAQYQHDLDGLPICPEELPQGTCPRL